MDDDAIDVSSEQWTGKRLAYLESLADNLSHAAAARAIGISHVTAWRWRSADPSFDAACTRYQQIALDMLEASGFQRAMHGDGLLTMFYLKRWRNEYRDNHTITIDASVTHQLQIPDDQRSSALILAAQRLLAPPPQDDPSIIDIHPPQDTPLRPSDPPSLPGPASTP